jgi:hypothetical protein
MVKYIQVDCFVNICYVSARSDLLVRHFAANICGIIFLSRIYDMATYKSMILCMSFEL